MPKTTEATKPAKQPAPARDHAATESLVERHFLARRGRPMRFEPAERIPIVVADDFPTLGRMTALRFLEWVQQNPEGVISLPTGKTPEHFIRWTRHYLDNWSKKAAKDELAEIGLPAKKPELRGLRFVQIDEFYPIDPTQTNSFHYYVTRHYIRGFGLDPKRALLIDPCSIGLKEGESLEDVFPGRAVDLSLRSRPTTSALEERQLALITAVDQFCSDYEAAIREMGGIGFFLGGIGPDGHIGFNPRGSHHFSPTRLTYTNYETEAAAAGDLGGIEVARGKPVITIGLGTITAKPDATIIIFAAGDAKAPMVAGAVRNPKSVLYPASCLQGLANARFYLTPGACLRLEERQLDDVLRMEKIDDRLLERAIVDRAEALDMRLDQMRPGDERGDALLAAVLQKTGRDVREAAGWARERLLQKIERGLQTPDNEVILHTGTTTSCWATCPTSCTSCAAPGTRTTSRCSRRASPRSRTSSWRRSSATWWSGCARASTTRTRATAPSSRATRPPARRKSTATWMASPRATTAPAAAPRPAAASTT